MMEAPWSCPAVEALTRWLNARTGLSFPAVRRRDAEAGIRRAMAGAGCREVGEYLRRLEAGDAPLDDLVSELTVGETYFFRSPEQFEFVRRTALPEILRSRGKDHVVRAWSAGCASGEEAYSLAVLFEEEAVAGRAHILATDISRIALARARKGHYGAWSFRGAANGFAERCFLRRGEKWEIDGRFRKSIVFEYLNLALDSYPSLALGAWGMDLILCRNVFIYFDERTVREASFRLWETLSEGGWLITGPSDPPLFPWLPTEPVVTRAGVFYRRSGSQGRAPVPVEATSAGGVLAGGPARHVEGARAPVPVPGLPPARVSPDPGPRRRPMEGVAASAALTEARDAFRDGRYGGVLDLGDRLRGDAAGSALLVRAIGNLRGPAEAARAADEAIARLPLSAELHFLHGLFLVEAGRDREAVPALRKVVYLDGTLAIAHFVLGSILERVGDAKGARRAFRNALDLCERVDPQAMLPLSDGEPAGRLAEAARVSLGLLEEVG